MLMPSEEGIVPDVWSLIEYEHKPGEKIYAILSGYHGSYLSSPSWRRSTMITEVNEVDAPYPPEDSETFQVTTISGSTYRLHTWMLGHNSVTASVADQLLASHQNAYILTDREAVNRALRKLIAA